MKKRIIKFVSLCVLLLIVLVPHTSFAAENVIATTYDQFSLDMWHYSGGYWRIGNTKAEQIEISDTKMESLGGNKTYLEANYAATFSVTLPSEVKAALAEGMDVKFRPEDNGIPLDEIFKTETVSEPVFTDTTMSFSIKPIFNFSEYTLNKHCSAISTTIPLIDKRYGNNIFAIYDGSKELGQGTAKFSEDSPETIYPGYLHPYMIKDSKGTLKAGYSFTASFGTMATDGLCVGCGTFSNAGACGLSFKFPVKIVFYYDAPDEPTKPDEPDPDPDPDPVPIPEVYVKADLALPSVTYEGHTVIAEDHSVIKYDGETYTPSRAYAKRIASNNFSIEESNAGTVRHTYSDEAEIVFSKAGKYNVNLYVSCEDKDDDDTEPIEVLATPHVNASLGGKQKQNRKQTLVISAAQNPLYPITELTIDLKEKSSGESIHIVKQFCSDEDAPVNSANIKYSILLIRSGK